MSFKFWKQKLETLWWDLQNCTNLAKVATALDTKVVMQISCFADFVISITDHAKAVIVLELTSSDLVTYRADILNVGNNLYQRSMGNMMSSRCLAVRTALCKQGKNTSPTFQKPVLRKAFAVENSS